MATARGSGWNEKYTSVLSMGLLGKESMYLGLAGFLM